MAGTKRRLDETDPARSKETKVQIPTGHQGEDPVLKRKVFRSGFRAGKTSESEKGGEVFQNGDYVCKAVARPCN
jgi:hypothetical protein